MAVWILQGDPSFAQVKLIQINGGIPIEKLKKLWFQLVKGKEGKAGHLGVMLVAQVRIIGP